MDKKRKETKTEKKITRRETRSRERFPPLLPPLPRCNKLVFERQNTLNKLLFRRASIQTLTP